MIESSIRDDMIITRATNSQTISPSLLDNLKKDFNWKYLCFLPSRIPHNPLIRALCQLWLIVLDLVFVKQITFERHRCVINALFCHPISGDVPLPVKCDVCSFRYMIRVIAAGAACKETIPREYVSVRRRAVGVVSRVEFTRTEMARLGWFF